MLEMRPECERCHQPLSAEAEAFVCRFECTFCPDCTNELGHMCPNCSGELVRRPRRDTPATSSVRGA